MFLYVIHCRITDKYYVGKTVQKHLNSRWYMHKRDAAREESQMYIHRAMRKHGVENFDIYSMCTCSVNNEQLSDFEQTYISLLGANDPKRGYNLTKGGDGTVGRVCSEETKRKIGNKNKGRVVTEETRLRLSVAGKGKTRSDETRRRMSIARTGEKRKPLSEEHKRQISLVHTGKKRSEETKRNISLGQLGNKRGPLTPEHKLKLSIALTGQKRPRKKREEKEAA